MSAPAIRLARPEDAEAIAGFNIAMALETEAMALEPGVIGAGVRALFDHPERGYYVVAEADGEIAGSLMVTTEWSDWRNGLFWWIQSVYVRPEFRRRGVYRSMYAFVRNRAAESPGICGFRLYVEKDNAAALETYRSLGMEETAYRMFEAIEDES